jgi:hypothetical protein
MATPAKESEEHEMDKRRIWTEVEAFGLLTHLFATAEPPSPSPPSRGRTRLFAALHLARLMEGHGPAETVHQHHHRSLLVREPFQGGEETGLHPRRSSAFALGQLNEVG